MVITILRRAVNCLYGYTLRPLSLPAHLPVLDNILQLYAHELNAYFDFSLTIDERGRYRIKSAAAHLSDGWGYFIMAGCEYAGFVLLNKKTKLCEGVFISEFFILPRYRKGWFYREVIASLLTTLDGSVEYIVLKKNKRALLLFEDLNKKFLARVTRVEECVNQTESFRYSFNVKDLTCDATKFISSVV